MPVKQIEQIKPILGDNEANAVRNYILSGGWITEHTYTREFEKNICSFLNTDYCSVVPNGTIALILALKAVGINAGDKVAVPALTMIATANAVKFIGAEPVFTDVDEYGCMDIHTLDEDVDAVVYVSLNGNSSGLDIILDYCMCPVIEDACQSFGSYHNGQALGTFGEIGVFSFSPHKIITTGQGGAIVTNDKSYSEEVKLLKDFGRVESGKDRHPFFGINAKFTDLQAVVGIEQLKEIRLRIVKKKQIYEWYSKYIDNFPLMYSQENTPWFMCGYFKDRDKIEDRLNKAGIGTRRMYPVIPHEYCYGINKSFPIAEHLSEHCLWLPSSVDLEEKDVESICSLI